MASDKNEQLLENLERALAEIKKHGFKNYIRFSPLCLNAGIPEEQRRPCDQCLMWQFVPEELRTRRLASGKLNWTGCEEIPLNDKGDTLDSLSRKATDQELEATLVRWMARSAESLRRSVKPSQ